MTPDHARPRPRSFSRARADLWERMTAAFPDARPAPALAPVLDAAAALETILDVYTARAHAHGTVSGATTDEQSDKILRLLGPLPVGADAGRATVAVEVQEVLPALRLRLRSSEPTGRYEASEPTPADPLLNRWTLRPAPVRAPTGASTVHFSPQSFGLREGAVVLFRDADRTPVAVRTVQQLADVTGPDGAALVAVHLDGAGPASAHPVVTTPSQRTPVETTDHTAHAVTLPVLEPSLQVGAALVVRTSGGLALRTVSQVGTATRTVLEAATGRAALDVPVSVLHLSAALPGDAREILHGFVDAATVARTAPHRLTDADLIAPVPVVGPVDTPPGLGPTAVLEHRFLLVDADGRGPHTPTGGLRGEMTFDPEARSATFRLLPPVPPMTLRSPVTVLGNVVEVHEGETVAGEVLGSGQPEAAPQRFALARKPLTHDPPRADHPDRRSSLTVRVDGRRWQQAESFFGRGPEDEVYVVEQEDDGTAVVTFARALPAGTDNVVADYRFGGSGVAAPPGSLTQPVGAPSALRAVHQPTAGTAGTSAPGRAAKREALRTEALMLDRAVAVVDLAARAESRSMVDRADAVLHWLPGQQRAGVRVTYVGDAEPDDVLADLLAVSEPGLAVSAHRAVPVPATLLVSVVGDGVHPDADVAHRVRQALTGPGGLLTRARIPLGRRLPLEHLHAAVVPCEGVVAVVAVELHRDGATVPDADRRTGLTPVGGDYLDFSAPSSVDVHVDRP